MTDHVSDPGNDGDRPVDRLIEEVLRRSTVDPDFRRRLIADPYAAIRDAFGYEIAPSVRIRFVERDPDVDALIVLPDPQDEDGTRDSAPGN